MADVETVMKAVECRANDIVQKCDGCFYKFESTERGCNIHKILSDALELLKEQEEKNGEWITIWREDDPDTSTQARCSICNRISERPLGGYCKWCGAKMSQEWGVDG